MTQNPDPPRMTEGPAHLSLRKIQGKVDLAIALTLSAWSALTLAVQNSWGGPESSEKRDWFAGAVSELLNYSPDADEEYLEEFLLQVMNDEFEVNIEDGSGAEVAKRIFDLILLIRQGNFTVVDDLYTQWQERQHKGGALVEFQHAQTDEAEEVDTDWDSDDMDEDDEGVNLKEASLSANAPKERLQPQVDAEGFIEVVRNKKR